MITHFFQRYGLTILVLLMQACNVNRGTSVKTESMNDTLVFTGCQEKIILKEGTIAEIRLEAIQGTGYQWLLKEKSPLLEQSESDELKFAPKESEETIPGMAGYQILQFKAIAKGNSQIQLEYVRTFENQVEKSCLIQIEVQ